MKATIALGVAHHRVNGLVAIIIEKAAIRLEILTRLSEVIVIDEVVTSVIRRVNVDHLDLAEIVLTENLQHVEIVALDVEIFGIPKSTEASTSGRSVLSVGVLARREAARLSGHVN